MSNWIKCSDRLPDKDGRVIIFSVLEGWRETHTITRSEKYIIGGPTGGYFCVPNGWVVTHWMPMPEPPPEDEYKKATREAATSTSGRPKSTGSA